MVVVHNGPGCSYTLGDTSRRKGLDPWQSARETPRGCSKLWGPKVERCRPQGLRAERSLGSWGPRRATRPQPQAQPSGAGRCHGGTRAEPGGSGRSRTAAGPLKPVPPPRPAPGPTAGGTRGRRWWAAVGLLRQPGPRSPDGAGPEPPAAALSRTEPPGTALGGRGGGAAGMLGSASLGRSPGGTAGREPCAALAVRGAKRRGESPGHVLQSCGAALASLSRGVPLRAFWEPLRSAVGSAGFGGFGSRAAPGERCVSDAPRWYFSPFL